MTAPVLETLSTYCELTNYGRRSLWDSRMQSSVHSDEFKEVYSILNDRQRSWFVSRFSRNSEFMMDNMVARYGTFHDENRIVNILHCIACAYSFGSKLELDSATIGTIFGIYATEARSDYKLRLEQSVTNYNRLNHGTLVVDRTSDGIVLFVLSAKDPMKDLHKMGVEPTIRMVDQFITTVGGNNGSIWN